MVELVVILVCAALFATLGAAVVQNAAEKADAVACAAQQKVIGVALFQYAADNQDYLPYFDDETGIPECHTRVTWGFRIHTYLPQETGNQNFFCPAAQLIFTGDNNRSLMDGPESCAASPKRNLERYRSINYGINFEFAAGNVGQWHSRNSNEYVTAELKKIVRPGEKILTADAWDGKNSGRYVIASYASGSNKINPCHDNGANILWCDGHVSYAERPNETLQKGDSQSRNRYFNTIK